VNDTESLQGSEVAFAPDRSGLPSTPARPVALAVPNVSEGRDPDVIRALADSCRLPGVRVLDVHSDPDHHRSVITVAGDPLALSDAMVCLAWECYDLIDLRRHRGVHPRIGALDVVPFVALTPDDIPLATDLARGLATRIGEEINLPTFLYGFDSPDETRTRPRDFRRGGTTALQEALETGSVVPAAGPPRLHPSAGGVLVGARPPLVAWNVWLPDAAVEDARVIAARVREAGGGLEGVRALGFYLPEAAAAQVSMNLEDIARTPPARAVAAVRAEAERLGVEAGDSEIVGLIPGIALRSGPSPSALRVRGFRPGQVLEAQMRRLERKG
jgi:glutamate formiminotransferase